MRWTEDRRKVEIARTRNDKQQAMRDVTSRQRSREYALFYYCSVVSLRSDGFFFWRVLNCRRVTFILFHLSDAFLSTDSVSVQPLWTETATESCLGAYELEINLYLHTFY